MIIRENRTGNVKSRGLFKGLGNSISSRLRLSTSSSASVRIEAQSVSVQGVILNDVDVQATATVPTNDILTNSGFESGDFTGWTDIFSVPSGSVVSSPDAPEGGKYARADLEVFSPGSFVSAVVITDNSFNPINVNTYQSQWPYAILPSSAGFSQSFISVSGTNRRIWFIHYHTSNPGSTVQKIGSTSDLTNGTSMTFFYRNTTTSSWPQQQDLLDIDFVREVPSSLPDDWYGVYLLTNSDGSLIGGDIVRYPDVPVLTGGLDRYRRVGWVRVHNSSFFPFVKENNEVTYLNSDATAEYNPGYYSGRQIVLSHARWIPPEGVTTGIFRSRTRFLSTGGEWGLNVRAADTDVYTPVTWVANTSMSGNNEVGSCRLHSSVWDDTHNVFYKKLGINRTLDWEWQHSYSAHAAGPASDVWLYVQGYRDLD